MPVPGAAAGGRWLLVLAACCAAVLGRATASHDVHATLKVINGFGTIMTQVSVYHEYDSGDRRDMLTFNDTMLVNDSLEQPMTFTVGPGVGEDYFRLVWVTADGKQWTNTGSYNDGTMKCTMRASDEHNTTYIYLATSKISINMPSGSCDDHVRPT